MPDTGGSNVPALNELLREFGIALGESVLEGYFDLGSHGMYYASGTSLIRFPQTDGAIIIERDLHDQGLEVSETSLFMAYRFLIFVYCIAAAELRKIKDKRALSNTWNATN